MSGDGATLYEYLGTAALAVGALGTASFGIVDGLKLFAWIDLAGYERLFSGKAHGRRWLWRHKAGLDPLLPALEAAYGSDAMEMLKAQYRCGRSKGDITRSLRQGVRIGFSLLDETTVAEMIQQLGIDGAIAGRAARALTLARQQRAPAAGEAVIAPPVISEDDRAALARLETTIDARIDSALSLAEKDYVTQTKVFATVVALAIAFAVGRSFGQSWVVCFVVGIIAVPIAPVAKDVASAISEAVKVFRRA